MPDSALSVQDMKDYGYAWAGVLPAGHEAAEKALEKGCEVYYNIAAKCDKETMLQREYTPDCMENRNRYMVDHADYLLAVWNGSPSGTGKTVRYAHQQGKPVIIINPISLDVTQE